MTDKNTELEQKQAFDPLDMNNYKVEKLPKMKKSGFEKWMARVGGPLAILVFILIYWCIDIPLFDNLNISSLGEKAEKRLETMGCLNTSHLADSAGVKYQLINNKGEVVDQFERGEGSSDFVPAADAPVLFKDFSDVNVSKTDELYIELVSKSDTSVPLKGWTIKEFKKDSTGVYAKPTVCWKASAEAEIKPYEPLTLDDNPYIRICYAMLAIFCASIILWITEAIPSYLTSLLVILAIVLCGVTTQKDAFAQLGHPVMWLNILSFVLASMLVKTKVAKRFAIWFVLRFGKSAFGIFLSFLVINVVLSMFISATTVKATILLPIFMVIAAIFGASQGKRNNFGRNLVLQNLFQVNIGASAFMTGSGANLLAVSLMLGAYSSVSFGYSDWLLAGFPLAMILLLLGWFIGVKVIFPIKEEDKTPQLEGGMVRLREELASMGKMTLDEFKSIAIFVGVLLLWVTKDIHGIDETTVAFMGAIAALLPGVGVVKWNDVDIPWHLMLFSAGAYTLGSGLNATDLPNVIVSAGMDSLGITADTPFIVLYLIFTGLMLFSGLLFQSKTMRALIFIPIAIGVEQKFGLPPLCLSFPVALLIEHVYVLPFNSKPAALLYTTNHYSWSDTFKFGITMMLIAWVLILIWGETVLHWLGYTPGLF